MKKLIMVSLALTVFAVASSVKELSSSSFTKAISSSKPTLVKFYAVNCYGCKVMKPHYEKVANKYSSKLNFAKLNTDKYPNIAGKYRIMVTPTTLLFKNGKEIDRATGSFNFKYLKAWADSILNYFKRH